MNVELLDLLKEEVENAESFKNRKYKKQEMPFNKFPFMSGTPDFFDMRVDFGDSDCGTAGCLLGFGCGMPIASQERADLHQTRDKITLQYSPYRFFAERFDLPYSIAENLCNPLYLVTKLRFSYGEVTPAQAAQAVQNVINGAQKATEIWAHMPMED